MCISKLDKIRVILHLQNKKTIFFGENIKMNDSYLFANRSF